jgi:DNA polymerase-3 subunit delta
MKPKSSGLAPDVFIKQIENGNIPTVVCIVGEEPYYRDLVRRTLLDAIFTDTPTDSRDISVFEEKTDMKKLDTLINTYPFFSGRTVIFITDKELLNPKAETEGKKPKSGGKGKAKEKAKETSLSKQEQFQNLLGDVPDFCTVILQAEKMDGRQKFTKFLQKETVFVDCSPVDSRYLPSWLARQAEQRGGHLDRGAVQRIQEYLATVDNPPLQLLAAEVEKIAVYAGDRKNWTAADVDMLFSALPEIGVFALNNAITAKNTVLALQLLAEEQKKNTYLPLLAAKLLTHLRSILMVKEGERLGRSASQIAAESHKAPFLISMWQKEGTKFTEARLRNGIQALDTLVEEISLGGRQYDRLEEIIAILCA